MERRSTTIFWTPYATHYTDLMFEDIGKFFWIQETVEKAKAINKYIYNHTRILSMMRPQSEDNELIHLVVTRYATNSIALECGVSQKLALKRDVCNFVGPEWTESKYAKTTNSIQIGILVYNEGFQRDVEEVVTFSEPLIRFLQMVDTDNEQWHSVCNSCK